MMTVGLIQRRITILSLPIILACLMLLDGCKLDHELAPKEYAKIYIPQARNNPAEQNIVTGLDSIQVFKYQANYGGPGKPKKDIHVNFSVDPALVDSFNNQHFTSYPILPENNYELSGLKTTIKAGQYFSPELTLTIDGNQNIPAKKYLLPITIKKTDAEVPINEKLRTVYFVFDAHLIKPAFSKVIITGFLVNPSGADVPKVGDTRDYTSDGGPAFTFKGGMEYVQLMALKDIDFSETPYSLVVGRYNNGPMTDGWATGGQTSFKFNLTEGTAAAGTFFYVGEGQMVIVGYHKPEGFSTDISNANWIRNVPADVDGNTSTLAGDGFGSSTTGLFTNGQANATGIAVFEGTNVTASSIPKDVVFYGGSVGDAYQPPDGYKVPTQSDLYSATDPESGNSQPLFGQGTNNFSVSGANANMTFVQMGGTFSANHMFQPRTLPNLLKLSISSTLSDIEGEDATKYIEGY